MPGGVGSADRAERGRRCGVIDRPAITEMTLVSDLIPRHPHGMQMHANLHDMYGTQSIGSAHPNKAISSTPLVETAFDIPSPTPQAITYTCTELPITDTLETQPSEDSSAWAQTDLEFELGI